MRWLVDGMNVIGSRPDGWWRDRERAMRALVEELEDFAAQTGDDVTVVFDGRPFELQADRVDVVFATRRGRDAADDDIARLAGEAEEELTVVTSDAELARRVEAAHAAVLGARAFRERLG